MYVCMYVYATPQKDIDTQIIIVLVGFNQLLSFFGVDHTGHEANNSCFENSEMSFRLLNVIN